MPALAFIGLKSGIGSKVAEFRWPAGKEISSSIRSLSIAEFVAAVELAAVTLNTMKGENLNEDTLNTVHKLVEENTRMSKYIAEFESKVDTNLQKQMNEHTELLLSNHLLLKNLTETLVTKDDIQALHREERNEPQQKEQKQQKQQRQQRQQEKLEFKPNRWQEHLFKVSKESGLPLKEAMSCAKETYTKL